MKKQPELFLKPKQMADLLKQRLRERHVEDLFAAEALTGSGGSMRFDGWAMEPTWQRERCVGYEIKVQRSDFMGDKKWTGYLPYCSEFFFVCPTGLIRAEELPPEVGLLWATANGSKLYQKKAAIPRPIAPEPLAVMLRHVLMWRYQRHGGGRTGREGAEAWLRDMEDGAELDHKLKAAIRRASGALTIQTLEENARLVENQAKSDAVMKWLDKNGIDIKSSEWSILADLEDAKKTRADGISKDLRDLCWQLEHSGKQLTEIAAKIKAAEA